MTTLPPSAPPTPAVRPVVLWLAVLALLDAATLGGYLLKQHASLASQALLYVLAVVVASYSLGLWPSVLCALGAVTAFNFFFVPPRYTLAVDNPEDFIALLVMLAVALLINQLVARLRRETRYARQNADRARQLKDLATDLAEAPSTEAVLALGQHALDASFPGPNHLALGSAGQPPQGSTPLPDANIEGLQCCMREAAALGPGTGRWPGLNAWYLPLGNREHINGAVCLENITAADTLGREHAQALCALLSQTLWRLKLSTAMLASQAESQRQQVQSTYLAAISHDLRTPLATIVGAASSLLTQRDKLGTAEQTRLLHSIASEATHLSTVTENTLQLVQLTNAAQAVQRSWESMEEIVGAVLGRLRARDTGRRIKSKVPEGLPLIEANPVLLAQLLENLLDNALKYSPNGIDLVVAVDGKTMQVSVKDRGTSIPEQRHESIFAPYSRNDQSGQRGAGLGLALCRAIATAHGGTLTVWRRGGGGNRFTLSLPLADAQPTGGPP